jgi:rubrerythrin
MSSITKDELWVLSYYRASELAGALFFGRLARRCSDDDLRVFLTEHFSEEASHAWLWTKAIQDLGLYPIQLTETYQSVYARELGIPTSMPQVLLLTKVFEERIFSHFTEHLKRRNLHPVIKKTLETMLEEEAGHLDWIIKKLKEYKAKGIFDYVKEMRHYKTIDRKAYQNVLQYETRLWKFLKK